jgi:predicted Zn-dependent protease with MMP-like domain
MIYRIPLMEACETLEQLAEEVRKTLIHELGHYAGMTEEQLEELGYGSLGDQGDDLEGDTEETGDKDS